MSKERRKQKDAQLRLVRAVRRGNPEQKLRRDHERTAIGMAPLKLLEGEETRVSLMHWQCAKIARTCWFSGSAETKTVADGADDLCAHKMQWADISGNCLNPHDRDASIKQVPGMMITDTRNVSAFSLMSSSSEERSGL